LTKAKSENSKTNNTSLDNIQKANEPRISLLKEKAMSIAQKVQDKIASSKENEPLLCPRPPSQNLLALKERSNSSCFHTNPHRSMKSLQLAKDKKEDEKYSINYFSK
jgi:hypothetical protein